jgi:secreted trypsin-like serine protease
MDLFTSTDTVPRAGLSADFSRGDQGRATRAGNGFRRSLADNYLSHLQICGPTTENRDNSRASPQARSLLARVIAIAILASLAFPALALASSGSIRHATARLVPRIVGGTTAAADTFPWLAFIADSTGPNSGFTCTGTVVSSNVILTAGHCAEDTTTGSVNPPGGYAVVTGSLDWTDVTTRQVSGVSQVIAYPGYNPSTGQGDAALLVLSTPTTAPAIPLATASDVGLLAPGTASTISGWGETVGGDPNSTPTALQWAITVVQSPSYCDQQLSSFAPFDPYTQVCALNYPYDNTGTCFGDSGGPLLANDLVGQNGNPTEIGIAVEVVNNCDTAFPDIYTRVDVISPWANGWITAVKPPPPPPPPPPTSRPADTSPPTISGSAVEGQTLLASTGTWSGTGPLSFADHWQRCGSTCSNITAATGSTYTLATADVGLRVRVVVNASNSVGSAQATSSQFGPIAPSTAHIRASLTGQITPHGKAAGIAALMKSQGYVLSFTALSAGNVVIDWYYLPNGAHLVSGKPKPVLVAVGKATFTHAGTLKITIRLTANGKRMLKHTKRLTLTAQGTFTPTAQHALVSTKKFTLTR